MLSKIKYFTLFLAASLFTTNVLAASHLIFAADLIRHGDRTPIHEIPKSTYIWKEGLGQLTQLGKQQEFNLGVQLRKKYIDQYHLLPAQYTPQTLYVRSTDIKRTQDSAQALLLGLYPLTTRKLSDGTYQPISIYTVPKSQDNVLYVKADQSIFSLIKIYYQSKHTWNIKTKNLRLKIYYWSKATGMPLNNFFQLINLADNLRIRKLKHVPYPAGITPQDADEIIALGNWAMIKGFKMKEIYYKTGHNFLLTLSRYINEAIQRKTPLKFILFSAHDSTILSVMSTMGASLNEMPPYASDLNFSLFNDGNKYFIKVNFNNRPVNIPACGGSICSYNNFLKLANS